MVNGNVHAIAIHRNSIEHSILPLFHVILLTFFSLYSMSVCISIYLFTIFVVAAVESNAS